MDKNWTLSLGFRVEPRVKFMSFKFHHEQLHAKGGNTDWAALLEDQVVDALLKHV